MSEVLAFPNRVTVDVETLAKWLAEANDIGFAAGMMEAGASDVQRFEAQVERHETYDVRARLYAAQIVAVLR